VDLIGERFHALWEFGGVGDESSGAGTRFGGPAVVDVDVCVPGVFESETYEGVGGFEGYGCAGCGTASLILRGVNIYSIKVEGYSRCEEGNSHLPSCSNLE
jgi:hypothetical protein